jgi:uncharacterized protein
LGGERVWASPCGLNPASPYGLAMSTANSPSKRRGGCPLCGKAPGPEHTPFCSQGCRDRDLLNWLGDAYSVPGPPAEEALGEMGEDGLDSGR